MLRADGAGVGQEDTRVQPLPTPGHHPVPQLANGEKADRLAAADHAVLAEEEVVEVRHDTGV